MSYSIPVYCCIFPMYMYYFFAPFSQLCYRIDKLYHLMCRLPFQSEVIILYFLKHHFPCFRVKTDITCRMFPCSIHKAILNSQLHSLFFCKISQFPEYLAKLFICGFYRFSFPRSCKSTHMCSSEFSGSADYIFQCFPMLCILDRIAIVSNCRDFGIRTCQQFFRAQCQLIKVSPFQ